jgi:type IV pilus assembly protein PilO
MTSQIGKQLAIGAVVGVLISGGIWYALGGKREELDGLKNDNEKLVVEVEKGKRLKADYEMLKKEVDEQEKRIAELVKLFPLDSERSRVAYMIQKLASASALGQVQGWVNMDKPIKTEYYMEYPTNYRYLGGFHEFGKFLSFASGFDKIINISDIVMTRDSGKGINSAVIEFRLSIFVYDAKSLPKAPTGATKAALTSKNED